MIYFVFLLSGPSYSVVTTGTTNAQGSHVVALFLVRNTGTSSGTPTCTVRIRGANGLNSKTVTIKETKPVDPGKVRLYATNLTVPYTKASQVKATNVQATCT